MRLDLNYFTSWSFVFLGTVLLIQTMHGTTFLTFAAAINSAVVSVLGAAVIPYIKGNPQKIMFSNFVLHALPMIVSWLLIARLPRGSCSWTKVACTLLALDLAWLCTPYKNTIGMEKIKKLYRVPSMSRV